jgi:hypothetical protein
VPLFRMCVVVVCLATVAGSAGCQASPRVSDRCPKAPAADVSTAAGWIGWLARHPDDVSFVLNDGRGGQVAHRPDSPSLLASAAKVVHLAAYAREVAAGRVHPDDRVLVAEWEAWLLPGSDGGAHLKALDDLRIPRDRIRAKDPRQTVRLDDLVRVMIRFSDNAAPDLLRARLGDDALRGAARSAGWADPDLPTYLGQALALIAPERVSASPDRRARAASEWALARRYAADPALRAELGARPLPGLPAQQRWAETTAGATARQLEALHRAIGTGSFGPGAGLARRHLEWQPPPPGAAGLGFKNGTLAGVLAEGMTLRRTDGSVATATLLVHRMPMADWQKALDGFAHQRLLLSALDHPATAARLRCVS